MRNRRFKKHIKDSFAGRQCIDFHEQTLVGWLHKPSLSFQNSYTEYQLGEELTIMMTHINWLVARNLINPTNLDALETFN